MRRELVVTAWYLEETLAEATITAAEPAESGVAPAPVGRRRRPPAWLSPVGSVLGGIALIALHASIYGHWLIDDAGITFSYARNLAEGNGVVFQQGAPSLEGYSNPAWLALLALGRLIGLFDHSTIFGIPDYVLYPKALALLCCAGILVAFYSAARKVTRYPGTVTFVTGAVLAAIPSFVIWCFSGLENSLYALAVALLAVAMFRATLSDRLLSYEVALGTGLLVAAAALTRPDGMIYVAAYPIVVLIRLNRSTLLKSARATLLSVLAFAGTFGAYLTWRHSEFGRWVALTAVSKRQGPPELEYLARASELVKYVGTLTAFAFAVVVGMALVRPSKIRDGLVAVLVPLVLAIIAYAVLEPDWMGELRFATPVWCLASFAGTLAVLHVISHAGNRARLVIVVGLIASVIPTAALFETAAREFRAAPTVPFCGVAERYGRAFNGYADTLGLERATLVAPDMGGSGMTSRLALIDLAGLVEETTAEMWGDWNMTGIREYVFEEVKPTFIHTHTVWSTNTGIATDSRMERDYYRIYTPPNPEPAGDWVRKDAVSSESRLAEVRNYALTVMRPAEAMIGDSPRGHCGPTLRPGQLPWRPTTGWG